MTSRHQMRRQVRTARRAGMQPMMVINSGDQLPPSVALILARQAWHYRSELAPAYLAFALGVAGTYTHSTVPRWWVVVLAISGVGFASLMTFGQRLGLRDLAERLYLAIVVMAGGAWLTAATAIGPFAKPLPIALAIGTTALSVPWWTHRRRRMRVRVERQLSAWPEIAKAIGLAGSQVMSATVDLWGWRARLRLARGQTIADVTAKIPAIESGLGTFRGAVRVYPTPDDLANRCEVRVLNTDPHADAIPWPGPSATSITQPIEIGPFEDAVPCRVSFLRRHVIFGGTTGSGKSSGLNVLLGNLSACRDVVVWAIDLKKGVELKPWESCIDRLATTPDSATALLADAVAILQERAGALAASGHRVWEPSPELPALVIVIDEYAELAEEAPDAARHADSIARLGRATAVTLVAATQRPTQKAMGQGAVRSQMDLRICFRVRERRDVDLVLGQGMLNAGWNAHKLNAPGKFLISAPEHDTPKRGRAYLLTDQAVAEAAAHYADTRPGLDDPSRDAMLVKAEKPPTEVISADEQAEDSAASPENALWVALCAAPDEGWDVGELMRFTRMSRATVYRHLREHVAQERAFQVSRGRWRARTTQEPSP